MMKNVVILTGAGISAESGLRTFRDSNGLWENHRIEDVATPEAFFRNPKLVHDFYNMRRKQLLSEEVKPNRAHEALARLEQNWSAEFVLITQNVDNLHERAQSKNILHMHGELTKVRCLRSEKIFDWKKDTSIETICPCCALPGKLRPHIVWFGEIPLYLDEIDRALERCDLFVSIGTSGAVYPAAGFIHRVQVNGRQARTVEINLEASEVSRFFDEQIYGPASKTLPQFVDELISARSFTN